MPVDPSHSKPQSQPQNLKAPPPQVGGLGNEPPPKTYEDPAGVWSKFLSVHGNVATPEEVHMFIQGLLRMFNVIIQQQSEAAKRSAEVLKKAAEGEE
jgi:hypothetical protein